MSLKHTERLALVMAAAEYAWNDVEQARRWMNTPHPELEGRTPISVASIPEGAGQFEAILANLFHGLPV